MIVGAMWVTPVNIIPIMYTLCMIWTLMCLFGITIKSSRSPPICLFVYLMFLSRTQKCSVLYVCIVEFREWRSAFALNLCIMVCQNVDLCGAKLRELSCILCSEPYWMQSYCMHESALLWLLFQDSGHHIVKWINWIQSTQPKFWIISKFNMALCLRWSLRMK